MTGANGKPAGQSEVTSDLDGCAVMEFFGGGQGRSLSAYDRASVSWSQDYVDHQGLTLRLRGRVLDGTMRMEDSIRTLAGGMRLRSRFAWSMDSASMEVRQIWWLSTDGGSTEPVNFDGRYRKHPDYRPPAPPPAAVCRDRPGYRALDGMLGTWRVLFNETEVGRATLAATTGGCLIEESYIGDPSARDPRYRLTAFLYYDRYIDTWYRVQTDTHGRFHRLGGSVTDGALRVAGVITGLEEKPVNGTLVWRVESPDTLSQVWSVAVPPDHAERAPQFTLRWVRVPTP
ncbi:MAG: hypothetical protein SF070_13930 [Gemmatimonadota bacterium]|nr:hypothetical protein [Gemmatimonadota bacterium]